MTGLTDKIFHVLLSGAAMLFLQPSQASVWAYDAVKVNATACGYVDKPSWCSGSDIGAWVNSAIAYANSLGTGQSLIQIDPGSYPLVTTIVKPLRVALDCQGASLNRAATSGAAYISGTLVPGGLGQAGPAMATIGGTHNCRFIGPGYAAGHTDIGIYQGTDPAGVLTPDNFISALDQFDNVEVAGFATGYVHGNNTWQISFSNSRFRNNFDGIGVDPNATVANGENIKFINTMVYNNAGCGFRITTQNDWWTIYGGGIDYNASGNICGDKMNVSLHNVHIENHNGPLISATGAASIKMHGGVLAVLSATGGESGLIYTTSADVGHTSVSLEDVDLYTRHPLPYLIYTNGVGVGTQCLRGLNWGWTTPAAAQTDATNVVCRDSRDRMYRYSAAPTACSAASAGTLAMTRYARLCACNGSVWVFTSDGATTCSW